MKFLRRKDESAWEVVESRSVEPVPMYYDDEDLDIAHVGDADTCGTYVFDVKYLPKGPQFRNALLFARQQLLQEIAKKNYNVLLLESWRLTLFRKGKHHRIEVQYSGWPAHALGKLPTRRSPPFMGVLGGHDMPPTP